MIPTGQCQICLLKLLFHHLGIINSINYSFASEIYAVIVVWLSVSRCTSYCISSKTQLWTAVRPVQCKQVKSTKPAAKLSRTISILDKKKNQNDSQTNSCFRQFQTGAHTSGTLLPSICKFLCRTFYHGNWLTMVAPPLFSLVTHSNWSFSSLE